MEEEVFNEGTRAKRSMLLSRGMFSRAASRGALRTPVTTRVVLVTAAPLAVIVGQLSRMVLADPLF